MRYEVLKVFGNIKILLVIVCMFILSIVMAMKTDTIMFEGFNTNVYKYYMERLEGEYTQEKYDYVIDEYKCMQEHIANSDLYDEQYRNKLISAMEYRELSSAVDLAKSRIKSIFISRSTIVLDDNSELPLSRSYKSVFKELN